MAVGRGRQRPLMWGGVSPILLLGTGGVGIPGLSICVGTYTCTCLYINMYIGTGIGLYPHVSYACIFVLDSLRGLSAFKGSLKYAHLID
jgi:hypothetical protein